MPQTSPVITLPIDPNEQAQRAADAAWESARWAAWMFGMSIPTILLTVGLLIGAIVAAVYAKKTWQTTNSELGMMRDAEKQLEASKVTAWLVQSSGEEIKVLLRNGNLGPIYDLAIIIKAKAVPTVPFPTELIPGYDAIIVPPSVDDPARLQIRVLRANDYIEGRFNSLSQKATPIFRSADQFTIWKGTPETVGLGLELSFRDSAGISWHRDWHGKLTELRK